MASPLAAECAPFYCSLGNRDAILQSGGTVVNGTLTFPAGINGPATSFNGSANARFTGPLFDAPSGSLSLWFRKNSSDAQGGIMEMGHLGSPNSIGLFYANSSTLYFEMRNSSSQYKTVYAAGALSQTQFRHVVAIWDQPDDTVRMKLFLDGLYVAGETLSGTVVHDQGFTNLGVAGSGQW